jgi:predicted transcriptional regulator
MKTTAGHRHPSSPTPRIWDLVHDGDTDGTYESRSAVHQAIVTAFVSAEWAPTAVFELLAEPSNVGGEHLRTRSNGRTRSLTDQRQRFDRSWRNAVAYVNGNRAVRGRPAMVAELVEMRDAALARPWPGRAGATDRPALAFIYRQAIRFQCSTVFVSVRDLAESIGAADSTAARSLQRLRGARLIRRVGQPTDTEAAEWQLVDVTEGYPVEVKTAGRGPAAVKSELVPISDTLGGDAWRHAALGKSAGRVWAALDSEWTTVVELSERLGASRKSLYDVLKPLVRYHLAEHVRDTYRRGRADPDSVARLLGTDGMQARQRAAHAQSRDQRKQFRERRSHFSPQRDTVVVPYCRCDLCAVEVKTAGHRYITATDGGVGNDSLAA